MKMKRLTAREKRQALWTAAMPEVKKLVRKFDRAAIAHCLANLMARDRTASKVAEMKRELASLQRKL